MKSHSLDYEQLSNKLASRKAYKLSDVKDKIERVAFDVVRFRDADNLDKLWIIQQQNGEDVIIAMYDEDGLESKASVKIWDALVDNSAASVTIFYKNDPITRLSVASLGIPKEEAKAISSYLPKKLASDKSLVNALLNDLPQDERDNLLNKYPELKG